MKVYASLSRSTMKPGGEYGPVDDNNNDDDDDDLPDLPLAELDEDVEMLLSGDEDMLVNDDHHQQQYKSSSSNETLVIFPKASRTNSKDEDESSPQESIVKSVIETNLQTIATVSSSESHQPQEIAKEEVSEEEIPEAKENNESIEEPPSTVETLPRTSDDSESEEQTAEAEAVDNEAAKVEAVEENGTEEDNKRKKRKRKPKCTKTDFKEEDSCEKRKREPSPGKTEEEGCHKMTQSKKRKKRSNSTSVTKEDKKEDGPATTKKKAKRQRVPEATVRDAAEKMLAVLIQNYKDDIKQVPLDVLVSFIKNKKGKTYTNYRSDAIMDGLKLLKAENKAEKFSIPGEMGAARLLSSEINKIPKEVISKDPVKVLEQRRQQFLDRLAKNKKGGTGQAIVDAANAVWDKLKDGKAYSRKELVAVTSYKATNSSGFEAIMKVLCEASFVEGKGKSKSAFTSKVFPYGNP